jgi:protein tyrosine/serine phosphatase
MKRFIVLSLLVIILFSSSSIASTIKYPTAEVLGSGPYPYNYRVVDNRIHAGGHPLNPQTYFTNSDAESRAILNLLKSRGVNTIIDLENTPSIQFRYQRLLEELEIKRIHIPLHSSKLPNKIEWENIKQAMKQPVYIHCKWGADRTGAIIGRYLVEEKNYPPAKAYQSVISGGSHAGIIGGLKTGRHYENLKRFIWHGPNK